MKVLVSLLLSLSLGLCGSACEETSGHHWAEATCTTPKFCTTCLSYEGEPLGHDFAPASWHTAQEPTCQAAGESVNTCTRCGESETRSIPVIACTPGDWQKTDTASAEARYCTMCGKELDRRSVIASETGSGASSGGSGNKTGSSSSGNGNTSSDYSSQFDVSATYVLNKNTMKFHHPSCRDVSKIKAKNRSSSNSSRSALIAAGYSPCKHCNP